VKPESQPTNHAAEDSGKCLGIPVLSGRMRFLPTTPPARPKTCGKPATLAPLPCHPGLPISRHAW
jgi:hypothetical protein